MGAWVSKATSCCCCLRGQLHGSTRLDDPGSGACLLPLAMLHARLLRSACYWLSSRAAPVFSSCYFWRPPSPFREIVGFRDFCSASNRDLGAVRACTDRRRIWGG